MSNYSMVGMFAETSVIGGFGILSLSQGLNIGLNLGQSVAIASAVMGVLFLTFLKNIRANTLEEAEEAIAGDKI